MRVVRVVVSAVQTAKVHRALEIGTASRRTDVRVKSSRRPISRQNPTTGMMPPMRVHPSETRMLRFGTQSEPVSTLKETIASVSPVKKLFVQRRKGRRKSGLSLAITVRVSHVPLLLRARTKASAKMVRLQITRGLTAVHRAKPRGRARLLPEVGAVILKTMKEYPHGNRYR